MLTSGSDPSTITSRCRFPAPGRVVLSFGTDPRGTIGGMTTRATRLLAVTLAGGPGAGRLLTPVAAGIALVSNGTPAPAGGPSPSTTCRPSPRCSTATARRSPARRPVPDPVPTTASPADGRRDRRHRGPPVLRRGGRRPAGAAAGAGEQRSRAAATQGGSTITQQYVKNYLINVVDRHDPAAQRADRADTLGPQGPRGGAGAAAGAQRVQGASAGRLPQRRRVHRQRLRGGAAAHAYFGTTAATSSPSRRPRCWPGW